jgi:hypothetical protein
VKTGQKITKEEADQLEIEGAAMLFDCTKAQAGGYFPSHNGNLNLLVITDDGYFHRQVSELQVGPGELFVRLPENDNGIPLPSFEEVFTLEKM